MQNLILRIAGRLLLVGLYSLPSFAQTAGPDPLVLLHTTYLPEITGDFDHFAVDLEHRHLFVAAEAHHSLEMFDLNTGKHLRSIAGVQTPHTIAYIETKNEVWVEDGGASAMVILDASDFHETARIALTSAPDAGLYDRQTGLYYAAHEPVAPGGRSTLSIFSTQSRELLGEIALPSANLESMAIDHRTNRLLINMRDRKLIAVIDLAERKLASVWDGGGLNLNTTLALDTRFGRVFIAGRKPGKFTVLDASTGRRIDQQDCVEIADDMTWDSTARRIYITGSQGVSVFSQTDANHYTKLAEFPTNGGKTSVYVPELKQLYIVHTKTDVDMAALQVFRVR